MSDRKYADFIQDIIDAINSINKFMDGLSFDDFAADDKTSSAVTRKFEIIGEAANRIPKNIQDKYPEIPWSYMVGMRNKIIHDYDGVNLMIVYDSAKEDLKDLPNLLNKIINLI